MMPETHIPQKTIRRQSWTGLFVLLFFFGCCYAFFQWIQHSEKINGTPKPLRKALEQNEQIFSATLQQQRVKTYPKAYAASRVRSNGYVGLSNANDTSNWVLNVVRHPGDTLHVTLDEIRRLPKTEIVFDFKCIEGWSQISYWGGVKFSDFVAHYHLEESARLAYTGLETPDGAYYVGIDQKSMLHPQTLLCYESNGKSLPLSQGAPLRLIIPVKYGVKHLKRIGSIFFSNSKPRDYWYERGYDYFCGL